MRAIAVCQASFAPDVVQARGCGTPHPRTGGAGSRAGAFGSPPLSPSLDQRDAEPLEADDFHLTSRTSHGGKLILYFCSCGIAIVDRVVPTIPIEVRVARSGVYRVALQPSCGARVVGACAHIIEADFRNPLVPIRPVPSERLAQPLPSHPQSVYTFSPLL